MKYLLITILENTLETKTILNELSKKGYNGTVIASNSIKHALQQKNADEVMFLGLRHIVENDFEGNITFYIVLEKEHAEEVRNIIKNGTNNFSTTKGSVFGIDIKDFEGSF